MFGKRRERVRAGKAAAALLYQAAKRDDQDQILDILTGDKTTDDGVAQALMLFWGIAAEVPSVRTRLGEIAKEVPDDVRPAFKTSLDVIETGNQHLFQPKTARAQIAFIAVIVKVIADDPQGERLLHQVLRLA
jgi:hypothetical protein